MSKACLGILAAAVVGAACASSAVPNADVEEIIGGVPVTSAKLDAVGALVLEAPGVPRQNFCTGTLIAPDKVLTAKHCAVFRLAAQSPDGLDHYFTEVATVSFAIGAKAAEPKKLVTATRAQGADLAVGGVGFGSDVALYTLSEPITDVTPVPVNAAPLAAADVGKSFIAIGYGVQNAAGASGVRTMGNITLTMRDGAPFTAAYTWDEFKALVEGSLGRPLTAEEESQVRVAYERPLLPEHEAFFGAKDGDVQPCSGDSGGPLLRRVGEQLTVFGVASWVPNKATSSALCARGVTYATFGPSAVRLLDQDACGEPIAGRCDGTVAVRCLGRNEGGPRVTKTRCEELGLTCVVTEGVAGCAEL